MKCKHKGCNEYLIVKDLISGGYCNKHTGSKKKLAKEYFIGA